MLCTYTLRSSEHPQELLELCGVLHEQWGDYAVFRCEVEHNDMEESSGGVHEGYCMRYARHYFPAA